MAISSTTTSQKIFRLRRIVKATDQKYEDKPGRQVLLLLSYFEFMTAIVDQTLSRRAVSLVFLLDITIGMSVVWTFVARIGVRLESILWFSKRAHRLI